MGHSALKATTKTMSLANAGQNIASQSSLRNRDLSAPRMSQNQTLIVENMRVAMPSDYADLASNA